MYKLSAAEGNLPFGPVRRYVGLFVQPGYVHDADDVIGLVLEARRVGEEGYLLQVFREYGGWDRLVYWALADLIGQGPVPAFEGEAFVVVREAGGFTISDRMLRQRWEYVGTTQGVQP